MVRFAAMFVPTTAALIEGVTPASWTLHANSTDQALQRAVRLAQTHLGLTDEIIFGDGDDTTTNIYANIFAAEPIGTLTYVSAIEELVPLAA